MDIFVYIVHYIEVPSWTAQQQIELFHLLFTKHLGEKIDRSFFALKGGCNLRFYLKSVRYSEDIDFDVQTIARATLKNQVTKLLEAAGFQQVLRARQLEISDISLPKQTETTQRWKLKILGPASRIPVPTKIEFSRRGMDVARKYEAVDADVISAYSLYPVLCTHYTRDAAVAQKVAALIHRTETQARDVFDLDLLLRGPGKPERLPGGLRVDLDRAIENCVSISYADYKAQVVSYLAIEYQDAFGSEDAWNRMQENVLRALEREREERSR
jgi:predicted nucleotidyltransferase component of viral defense system